LNRRATARDLWTVHYMDSRFHNLRRIRVVAKAVEIVRELNRKEDEALLRIDALGWTYVEESRLNEAEREIREGLAIAAELTTSERDDLTALGHAWLARCSLEQSKTKKATKLIRKSLEIECSPWIRCRVNMAAGDIALKSGNHHEALQYYQSAAIEADRYGGEGHGYQTLPRIGLAYLGVGKLQAAKEEFQTVGAFEQIAIGKLYADYGLAMVALKEGSTVRARALIEGLREKLSRGMGSNLLSGLINKLYDDLEADPN